MITTNQISLTSIIGKKTRTHIDGTKLPGGTTIGDIKVNYQIANALRKIRYSNIAFSEVTVYLEDIMEDAKGFLFKKDGKEIFLNWTKNKKLLSNVIFKGGSENYKDKDEDILQAIILLEMQEQLTDINTSDLAKQLFTMNEIQKDSPEAVTLAKVVFKIEEAILNGVLNITRVTDDEYEVDSEKPLLVDELDTSSLGTIEKTVVEKESTPAKPVESPKKEEIETVQNKVISPKEDTISKEQVVTSQTTVTEPKQYSLFNTDSNSENESTIVKKEKPIVNITKPRLTKEEALAQYPHVSNHDWAEEKLRSFDLSDKFINECLIFRKLQLEKLTAEEILIIPEEGYYTGWTNPLKRGIAAFLTGKNLIIRGETSTGKSTLVKTICKILNYPMTFVGGSMDATLETFIGINTLEDGNVGVKNAPLIEAMEKGAIFYLDEGNAILPGIFIQLHSAMDRQRVIYNQLTGGKVKAHKNFRVVTCVNDGYAGTNELNPATLDRFVAIETKYMKLEDAKKYYQNFPVEYTEFQKEVLKLGDFSESQILELLDIQRAIQIGVEAGKLDGWVASQRNFEAILELSCLLSIKEAVLMVIQKYPKDERPSIASVFSEVESLNMTAEELLEI